MILRILVAMFSVYLNGCIHNSFSYRVEPVDEVDAAIARNSDPIYAEAGGFIWDSCEAVNDLALEKAKAFLKPDERIVDIKWVDYETLAYSSQPMCRKETGWVWAMYTFWWPRATKVGIQAKVISKEDTDLAIKAKLEKQKVLVERSEMIKNLKDLTTPLSILGHELYLREDQFGRRFVGLKLELKNNGNKRIIAYKVSVKLSTKLGNDLGTFELSDESSSLGPLEATSGSFEWKDNQFREGDIFDKLSRISTENLQVQLLKQNVVKAAAILAH
jgi:hypothetical protein